MDGKLFTCLNGSFVLAHRAAVAVADRGFRYGDGAFETIRVEKATPMHWDAHLYRLGEGLRAIHIDLELSTLEPYARKLLQKNEATEGFLRIAVSRGAGSRGYAPYPPGMPPLWVMEWQPGLSTPSGPARLHVSRLHRIPPSCLPTAAKLAQGLNSTLAAMEAQQHGADEALQLATDGAIAEASSANIFWLSGGTLFTPSLDTGCLAGITRETVLRIAPLPTRIVHEGLGALERAEAVFLTNSRVGVWPVASLAPLGLRFNPAHPLHRQIQAALAQERQQQWFRDRQRWATA